MCDISPESRAAVAQLARSDLTVGLDTARKYLRAHPQAAGLIGDLAEIARGDPETWESFRGFIGGVVADASASDRERLNDS
jgi:hypothetical protein